MSIGSGSRARPGLLPSPMQYSSVGEALRGALPQGRSAGPGAFSTCGVVLRRWCNLRPSVTSDGDPVEAGRIAAL